jgi:hypothetical protein
MPALSIPANVNQTIILSLAAGCCGIVDWGERGLVKMSLKRFSMPMLVKALWQVLLFCFVQ